MNTVSGRRGTRQPKGPLLLGVRAVITESFERIHRTNIVCMGILALQFEDGVPAQFLQLTGEEIFAINGVAKLYKARQSCELPSFPHGPLGEPVNKEGVSVGVNEPGILQFSGKLRPT